MGVTSCFKVEVILNTNLLDQLKWIILNICIKCWCCVSRIISTKIFLSYQDIWYQAVMCQRNFRSWQCFNKTVGKYTYITREKVLIAKILCFFFFLYWLILSLPSSIMDIFEWDILNFKWGTTCNLLCYCTRIVTGILSRYEYHTNMEVVHEIMTSALTNYV